MESASFEWRVPNSSDFRIRHSAFDIPCTLRNLNQSLNFPKVDKRREILASDYGREADFVIFLNRERSPLRLKRRVTGEVDFANQSASLPP